MLHPTHIFATMNKKIAEGSTQISCKLVPFIVLLGNPLKLCNTTDEEWPQKKKEKSREKISKLTAQRSRSRLRYLAK